MKNCRKFEPLIALSVEGDLREADEKLIEKHLEHCVSCRELRIELQESQAAFKSLRQGVVNSGALAEVRSRVLTDVGELEPAPAWVIAIHRLVFAGMRRRTAIAGVAVGALLMGGVWLGRGHHNAQPALEPVSPVAVAIVNEPVDQQLPVKPAKTANPRKHRVVTPNVNDRVAAESDSVQFPIKFVTDDPNIIIYWLPSDKGD
jgi:hypothetical protein